MGQNKIVAKVNRIPCPGDEVIHIAAVLRSLSLGRIERLLAANLEESEFELVRFRNQPSRGGAGVPDAIIHSSFRILIETKTVRNGLHLKQIQRHLAPLDEQTEASQFLLLLTPDDERPTMLDSVPADSSSFDRGYAVGTGILMGLRALDGRSPGHQ